MILVETSSILACHAAAPLRPERSRARGARRRPGRDLTAATVTRWPEGRVLDLGVVVREGEGRGKGRVEWSSPGPAAGTGLSELRLRAWGRPEDVSAVSGSTQCGDSGLLCCVCTDGGRRSRLPLSADLRPRTGGSSWIAGDPAAFYSVLSSFMNSQDFSGFGQGRV